MTAGHGVAHSEVSTAGTTTLHGVQLWVALPDASRDLPRGFEHHVPERVDVDGAQVRVLLGELAGERSPVATHTPLLGAEVVLPPDGRLELDVDPEHEHGLLVDTGVVALEGVELKRADLGYTAPGAHRLRLVNLTPEPARTVLLGGTPFTEQIIMWWNFVGRTHEEIASYRADWESHSDRFGEVGGYTGTTPRLPAPPMPATRLKPRLNPRFEPPGAGDRSAWG
jgi:hypothetical protein